MRYSSFFDDLITSGPCSRLTKPRASGLIAFSERADVSHISGPTPAEIAKNLHPGDLTTTDYC